MDACKCVECACKAAEPLGWPNVAGIVAVCFLFGFLAWLAAKHN